MTDNEVWDHLRTTLRSAIDHCGLLATLPAKGPTYRKIIVDLQALEGSARDFGNRRQDARWNLFGWEMECFHQRIGDAIRQQHARKIFLHMQAMMKGALEAAEKMKDAKTGRLGPITPVVRPVHRDTRPVYVRPSGLLVPSTAQ